MTREQVRFILGTPTLQDVFRSDRWDYPYYNKPGYGAEQQRKFTVWFEGDSLVRWEGDEQPDRQPFQKADTGASPNTPEAAKAPATPGDTQTAPVDTTLPKAKTDTAPPASEPPAKPENTAAQPRQPILNSGESRPSNPGVPMPGRNSGEPLR